jgi:hypothetical protein
MGGLTVEIPITAKMIAEFRKVADGKISRGLAARNLGINENTCRKKYNKWAASELGVVAAVVAQSKASKKSVGMTMDDIVAKFNPASTFLAVLEGEPHGEFLTDIDMMTKCGMTKAAWDRLRKSDKVKKCKVTLPDCSVVWAREKDADMLRQKLLEVRI